MRRIFLITRKWLCRSEHSILSLVKSFILSRVREIAGERVGSVSGWGLNEPQEQHSSGHNYPLRVKTRVKSVKGPDQNYPPYPIRAPPVRTLELSICQPFPPLLVEFVEAFAVYPDIVGRAGRVAASATVESVEALAPIRGDQEVDKRGPASVGSVARCSTAVALQVGRERQQGSFSQCPLSLTGPHWTAVAAAPIVAAGPGRLPFQQNDVGAAVRFPAVVVVLKFVRQFVRDDRADEPRAHARADVPVRRLELRRQFQQHRCRQAAFDAIDIQGGCSGDQRCG